MNEQEHSEKIRSVAEARRTRELSNVVYIRDYLKRHPESQRNIGRRAVRNVMSHRNRQDAKVYELFPAILQGNEPDDIA